MTKFLLPSILVLISELLFAQSPKATSDLAFLIGQWEIERTYNPQSDTSRILNGTLSCEWSMDNQFIKCSYVMERLGKISGLDEVYFNYNPIYGKYEHMWLSSTWPIKVLMQGDLTSRGSVLQLNSAAEFPIGNEVLEYVKSELTIDSVEPVSFQRKTHIRTSKNNANNWRHHMTEKARKQK